MKMDFVPTAIASAILTVALSGAAVAASMNGGGFYGQPESFTNNMTPATQQPGNFASKTAPTRRQPQSFANHITPARQQPGSFPSKTTPTGRQPGSFANHITPASKQPGEFASKTGPTNGRYGNVATNVEGKTVVNVNRLVGQRVINEQGRNVGRLKTLILNRSSGSVRYGVVSQNGGSYVVPWNLMQETPGHQVKVDVNADHMQADFSAFEPVSAGSNSSGGQSGPQTSVPQ